MTFSQRAVEAANAALRIVKSEIDRMGPNDAAARTLSSVVRHLEICVTNIDGVALQGWQDISTAPRDGTFILAYNVSHNEQVVVGWTQDAGLPELSPNGCWTDAGSRNRAINYMVNANYFQLWQPLPPPPAASEGEERK